MYKKQRRIAQRNKRNNISSTSRNNNRVNYTSNDKYRSSI